MAKHFKHSKYQLVAMDFEDVFAYPDNKPLLDAFSDEKDLLSKVTIPLLIVSPQELVDNGVEKLYIVSKGHYHPDGIYADDMSLPPIPVNLLQSDGFEFKLENNG